MNIVVIGGGASGMMASIKASKNGHNVTVLEHKDKIGKKLLATGNGRCNLTNEVLKSDPSKCYEGYDQEWLENAFNAFGYDDTIKFFEELGLMIKSRQGLVYPYSDQANAVLDALRFRMQDLGIKVISDSHVDRVEGNIKEGFLVCTDNGKKYKCDRVIIATGSKAQPKLGADGSGYEIAKKLGHRINRLHPGLVQLKSSENYFKSIAGTRITSKCSLLFDEKVVKEEIGELQITSYGLSGIVIMNLSNCLGERLNNVSVSCDLMPDYDTAYLEDILSKKIKNYPDRDSGTLLIGILPKKLGDLFLKETKIGYDCKLKDIEKVKIQRLANLIKTWVVPINGTNTFEECQITLGGVPLEEVDANMESKVKKGVYLCGEILDVHGKCGGFNLQLAWTTGYIAGDLK